jgi:glycine cleavage system aminomethyltransferase T
MSKRMSLVAQHLNLAENCGLRDACVTAAVYAEGEAAEYEAVRQRAALIDQNHFSKIRFSGDAAFDCVNHLILTDLARLPVDQAQQTFILNEDGSPLADAFVLNEGDTYLLLAEGVETSNLLQRIADVAVAYPDAVVADQTEKLGMMSIEGPYSWEVLKTFLGVGVIGVRYMEISPDQNLGGVKTTICRVGRSGEFGYFLLTESTKCGELWDVLSKAGEPFQMKPVGYKVLDTCRVENRIPNGHHEGRFIKNVLELNACVMVGRDKENYSGREHIVSTLESGPAQRIIGLSFTEVNHAFEDKLKVGLDISCGGNAIGKLVNVVHSGVKGHAIGLALVDAEYAYVGLDYQIGTEIGKTVSAPFIFNKSLQIRPQEDSFLAK